MSGSGPHPDSALTAVKRSWCVRGGWEGAGAPGPPHGRSGGGRASGSPGRWVVRLSPVAGLSRGSRCRRCGTWEPVEELHGGRAEGLANPRPRGGSFWGTEWTLYPLGGQGKTTPPSNGRVECPSLTLTRRLGDYLEMEVSEEGRETHRTGDRSETPPSKGWGLGAGVRALPAGSLAKGVGSRLVVRRPQ